MKISNYGSAPSLSDVSTSGVWLSYLQPTTASPRTTDIRLRKMLRDERMAGLGMLLRGIRHIGQRRLWAGHVGCVHAARRKPAIVQAVGMHWTSSSDHFGQMSPKSAKQTDNASLFVGEDVRHCNAELKPSTETQSSKGATICSECSPRRGSSRRSCAGSSANFRGVPMWRFPNSSRTSISRALA